jgi:ornithine cyclodeaminase/alanine dehydrogenase-like protein (mu-crystallin family)
VTGLQVLGSPSLQPINAPPIQGKLVGMPLVLTNHDIERALGAADCLAIMEQAYRALAAGQAVHRPTSHCYLPHSLAHTSYSFKSVEGGIEPFGVLALRITSEHVRDMGEAGAHRLDKVPLAGNGQFVGLVQLFSVETGELLAIMPDGVIQQVRVAVTSAIGVKALARPRSERLALIGTGGQARAHLRFLAAVAPIKHVRVFSPNPEHRKEFCATMTRECSLAIEPVESVPAALADSDIICTATTSSRPLFSAQALAPGVHYNAIREFEMDDAALERADVVAVHTRFGGIQHHEPPGIVGELPGVRREKARDWKRFPEIQELLVGAAPGRVNDRQISLFFNNVGTGIQFAAIGFAAYRAAKAQGLGRELPGDWFMQDIKP